MLDLIDAVERLKKGIVEGGVSLGQVEQAVGKVASGIDVYLILAVSRLLDETRSRRPSLHFLFFVQRAQQLGTGAGATRKEGFGVGGG